MARMLWIVMTICWLVAVVRVIQVRRRSQPDRRLLAALETLRGFKAT